MKKLGIAAALMLCAVGASASNFRAADQVYVPAAGHVEGLSGTFITDVYISNLTGDNVSVSVVYAARGQEVPTGAEGPGQGFNNVIQLRPHERKEIRNFFQTALNLPQGEGQLIFNACAAGTDCGPATQDEWGVSPNFRDISVQTRIYHVPEGAGANAPTTGQLLAGIPWYNFVSSLATDMGVGQVFITGITHTGTAGEAGTFRTNIGLANASQYSRTTIILTLYRETLTEAGRVTQAQVELGPLGNVQRSFPELFPGQPFGSNYFVVVEQRNNIPVGAPASCEQGCPAFLAYGSLIDNSTGDATTLEAQYLVPLNNDAILAIYGANNAGKARARRSVRH